MRERIAKVQNLLEKNNLDAFLFSSQPNVFYLSGFRSSHAYVVVSRHSYHLLTDGRYYQKAKEELKDWDVILLEGNVLKAIERLLKKIGAFKVGYEEDRVSCEFRRRLKGGLRWVGKAGFFEAYEGHKGQHRDKPNARGSKDKRQGLYEHTKQDKRRYDGA